MTELEDLHEIAELSLLAHQALSVVYNHEDLPDDTSRVAGRAGNATSDVLKDLSYRDRSLPSHKEEIASLKDAVREKYDLPDPDIDG